MKRVITYGTFDLFHKGHYNIIKRAKELGDYLIVGVTSDNFDLDRGKLNVRDSLATRMKNVSATGLADEIIIEEYQGQKVEDVQKYQIDTFVVGSDWTGKFDYLKEYCEVVYLERTKNISSTQIRSAGTIYRVGMIIDEKVDTQIIVESKLVSGLNVEAVYAPNLEVVREFAMLQEIEFYTSKYEEFLENMDIVYIASSKLSVKQSVSYIEQAILRKKHVICSMSLLENVKDIERLFCLANKHHVLLWDDLTIGYIRAFDQMVWFLKGNSIGKILSIHIGITCDENNMVISSIRKAKYLALYVVLKLIGWDVTDPYTYKKDGYESCYFVTSEGEVKIQIGTKCEVMNKLEIIGSNGKLVMSDDWWNVRYYRMNKHFSSQKERYSYTFEGNGGRYVFHSLLKVIMGNNYNLYKIRPNEIVKIVSLLNEIDI